MKKARNTRKLDEGVNRFMGMPMRWDRSRIFKNLWNPEDNRIFPPKYFGIGWSLNFHALLKGVGFLNKSDKRKSSS